MDAAPLVKAHDHARAASVATRQASGTTVAISEHTQAAGEFANAARTTSSVEALRTLKLLEEHHRRLAELLKLPSEQPSRIGSGESSEKIQADEPSSNVPDAAPKSEAPSRDQPPSSKASARMSSMAQQRRLVSREMSSSIASNLASARGIRSKTRSRPLSPSVSTDQAPGNLDPHPRRDGSTSRMQTIISQQAGKPTWVPPTTLPAKSGSSRAEWAPSATPEAATALPDDAGYTRFYASFGNLINKISAPLAFAGLPLIQEEIAEADAGAAGQSVETSIRDPKPPQAPLSNASVEPDLSKIYSMATLRALARDGHSAQDSFCVVPTTGHTMSYANILTYAEKEKRRLGVSGQSEPPGDPDEDEEDFVDAREIPVSLSPGAKRRVGRARTDKELRNTIEELYTENKSLKDMLDKLSKRLHAFEASAQIPAMALTESYRAMRPGSPLSSAGTKLPDDLARRKALEIEEQLVAAMKQIERLEKDNNKMQKTLDKYREKWEMLKAGAKARREAQGTSEGVEATESA